MNETVTRVYLSLSRPLRPSGEERKKEKKKKRMMTGRPRLAASNERVAESESVVEPKCSGGTHVETIRKAKSETNFFFSIQPF